MVSRPIPITICLTAALMAAIAAAPLFGQDSKLDDKIQELNRITGNKVIVGEYKFLTEKPAQAKKLIKHARKLLKSDKDALNYNSAFILAETAKKLDDLDACQEFYRLCARIGVKLESTRKIVQAYGGLIDLLYESNKFAESAKVCKELLELETGSGKPRIVLVPVVTRFGTVTYIEDNNYDSVRRIKPGVHRLLIQAITKDGKFDQAIKLADSLVKAQDHWRERQLKGWVLREAGKFQQAADTYEDVLNRVIADQELEEKERDAYEDQIRYILGNVYVDLNKVDAASKQLKSLIARHPDEPSYLNDLGYIWADHDMNLAEAEKMIRKAIELDRKNRKKITNLLPEEDKDNGAYLDSLGWVLFKQKKYKEAKEWLQKAVSDKAAQHVEIYDHLGDVLMALGEREAAIAAWKRGVELAGNSRREQMRRERVQKKLEKHSSK